METVADLFASFGGPAAVARAIGKGQSTASEMKRRRSVPTRYWPALLAAAKANAIELSEADLLRLHVGGGGELTRRNPVKVT